MDSSCPAFDASAPYVSEVLAFTDCHALALGADGWSALGPGGPFGEVIGGLLTVLAAVIGYRMLLGEMLSLRDAVSATVRIGMVMALATQWPAWQVLVFDVATQGPQEIASAILPPGGLGGEGASGLASRLQAVSSALDKLTHPAPPPSLQVPAQAGLAAPLMPQPVAPLMQLPLDARKSIASANGALLLTGVGGLVAVRLVIAILLAVGPLFVGFLLFDATRGLFVGWARVLGGAALGAVAVPTVLALGLAVIEPQVTSLQAQIDSGDVSGAGADQIWASAMVFAFVLLAALIAVAKVGGGLRLPDGLRHKIAGIGAPLAGSLARTMAGRGATSALAPTEDRGRAERIADAARAMERRANEGGTQAMPLRVLAPESSSAAERIGRGETLAPVRLGMTARRSVNRKSAVAGRRDEIR